MKTIGQVLSDARAKRRFSFKKLEEKTKIKSEFIDFMEREEWEKLPPFPTVLGFIKSLAKALDLPEKQVVAILRRDYPPRKLAISPKPDIESKFSWSPKLTFTVGVGIVLVVIFGYLGLQYVKFVSPPKLLVERPKEEEAVTGKELIVSGKTDTDAKVTVNNQPAIVDENGDFRTTISLVAETQEIVIKATSRSGKETVVKRKILVSSH